MQPIDIEEVKHVSGKIGMRNPAQTRMPLTSPTLTKHVRGIDEK
jgi:hypothetical protein